MSDPFGFGPSGGQPPLGQTGPGPGSFGAASAGSTEAFGPRDPQPPPSADPFAIVHTPVVWLFGTLVLGLLGAVLAYTLGSQIGVAFAAWVAAGPLAIGLLAFYALRDTALRTRMGYVETSSAKPLYAAAVLAAAVGIGLSAWDIALWVGRL